LGGRHVKGPSTPAPRELGVLWVHTSPRVRWVSGLVAHAQRVCEQRGLQLHKQKHC
jgi:hypothetical protein